MLFILLVRVLVGLLTIRLVRILVQIILLMYQTLLLLRILIVIICLCLFVRNLVQVGLTLLGDFLCFQIFILLVDFILCWIRPHGKDIRYLRLVIELSIIVLLVNIRQFIMAQKKNIYII